MVKFNQSNEIIFFKQNKTTNIYYKILIYLLENIYIYFY